MLHVVEVVNFVLSDEREKGCATFGGNGCRCLYDYSKTQHYSA